MSGREEDENDLHQEEEEEDEVADGAEEEEEQEENGEEEEEDGEPHEEEEEQGEEAEENGEEEDADAAEDAEAEEAEDGAAAEEDENAAGEEEPADNDDDAEEQTEDVEAELAESGVLVPPGEPLDELGLTGAEASTEASEAVAASSSSKPSSKPTSKPPSQPSSKPSSKPASKPSSKPPSQPSSKPSSRPQSASRSGATAAASSSKPPSKPSSRHSTATEPIESDELNEAAAAEAVDTILSNVDAIISSEPPRTPTPPPRPVTPLDHNAGAAGDAIAGTKRKEISTEGEKEIKQMKYAQEMAAQWVELLQQRHAATSKGQLSTDQTAYLLEHLVPILVEALSELLRVHEQEARALHQHNKQLRKNPSMKPRSEFRPLEWLASYLVRHNPKHVDNTNPLTLIYQKNIQEIVQNIRDKSAQQFESKVAE